MAASNKAAQKVKLDYNIDREVYMAFAKMCNSKGFAPNVIVQKIMQKYNETGQI